MPRYIEQLNNYPQVIAEFMEKMLIFYKFKVRQLHLI